ncbi:MAG: peptidase M15 [Deferribacteres bacterium]|nr:peptidase M15 [Deferribacteres bacterium]
MKRRDFLKIAVMGAIGWGIAPGVMAQDMTAPARASLPENFDYNNIKDYLHRMEHFDEPQAGDVRINMAEYRVFESVVMRLRRLQQLVGHGNFQKLSFDRGIRIARTYSEVGEFTREETAFMEKIFYTDASLYGFFGEKTMPNITDSVRVKDVVRVPYPYTGNYLYKGTPLETFKKIRRQVGEDVRLTSGIRGIMKQFLLFLNKAYRHGGNLSLASRSLAPPGYSFHANGDFDVGQAGLGADNFTGRFTTTKVYKRLTDLGYLTLRYPRKNLLGVRFEPWHIKVPA